MDKYVLKIETDNLDVYRQICKVLVVDVQENLMKLGNKESVFTNVVSIFEKKEED